MNATYSDMMAVLNSHANHLEGYLISLIYGSTPTERSRLTELKEVLINSIETFGYYQGLFVFYTVSTLNEKKLFDMWFEGELLNLKK